VIGQGNGTVALADTPHSRSDREVALRGRGENTLRRAPDTQVQSHAT